VTPPGRTSGIDDADHPGPGLAAGLAALHRRRWPALVVGVLALTAVVSVVAFLPDMYESSATVLIDRQQIPDEIVRSTVTSGLETRLHTISQEILSRARLQALIEAFDLYPEMRRSAPAEEVVERMREDIELELRGGVQRGDRPATVAFTIGYSGREPRKVAAVTNTLASFYIEENLKVRERQAAGTSEFLRVQLEELKRKLELQEQAVGSFKERHIGELPQQLEANLATIEQLNARIRLNSDQQVQFSERRAIVQDQLDEAEAQGATGSPRALAQRLEELKRQLAGLKARYSDRYPDVVRVKAEIASVEEQLARADAAPPAATAASPQVVQLRTALAELEARIRSLQAEGQALHAELSRYQSRVENVPRTEQEFQRLARDYEASKEQYRSLLMRQSEAEVAASMEQRQKGEQFRIIEPAVAAEKPAAPNRPLIFFLGSIVAVGLALATVFVAEQLDTSFHDAEALRTASRAPVLATIPYIDTAEGRRQRRRRTTLAAAGVTAGVAAIVALSYLLAGTDDGLLAGLILKSGS
jgi:polysaccharide chain length determinant protein (PEP-CTERM system associated)